MSMNQIPDYEFVSLGMSDTPYDRFLFNTAGDCCVLWSSVNAAALIATLTNEPSLIPLGEDVGFAAAYHPNNDILAICTTAEIRLYDFLSGSVTTALPLPAESSLTAEIPATLAFDQAGIRLAFGMGSNVYLYDVDRMKIIDIWQMNDTSLIVGIDDNFHIYTVSDFDRDSASFAIKPYKLDDFRFWTPISPLNLPRLSSNHRSAYFTIDGPYWRAEILSVPEGERQLFLPYSKSMVFCNKAELAVQLLQEPDPSSSIFRNNTLVCWDISRKVMIGLIDVDTPLLFLAGSDSSDRVAIIRIPTSINPNGRIDIFSLSELTVMAQVHTQELAINAVAMSPRGDRIIASVDGMYSEVGTLRQQSRHELFYVNLSQR